MTVVKSKTCVEHIQHFEEVFALMRKYNMKLNLLKWEFDVNAGKFLGFLVTRREI